MEVHRKDGDIENRPVSKGGKAFDLLTYFGIAGVGTFLATIPTGAMFLKGGHWHGVAQRFENGLKNIGFSRRLAEHGANTFATFWGGTLMLIPVGLMEKNRTKIVNAFNRFFNDPTDPRSIEDAPPQTAGSIVKARAVATATVFTGFVGTEMLVGEERFKSLQHDAGQKLASVFKHETHVMKNGKLVEGLLYKFGRTGALDVLATVSSATLLYIGSHFFAKRAYERRVTRDYMEQKRAGISEPLLPTVTAEAPALLPTPTPNDKPLPQITHAQHEHALSPAPEQPQLHA